MKSLGSLEESKGLGIVSQKVQLTLGKKLNHTHTSLDVSWVASFS